jgi:hypothetical protein
MGSHVFISYQEKARVLCRKYVAVSRVGLSLQACVGLSCFLHECCHTYLHPLPILERRKVCCQQELQQVHGTWQQHKLQEESEESYKG